MGEWKMSTARSSAEVNSQTHRVHGESSSLVASSVDDASNEAREHPERTSPGCFILLPLLSSREGGRSACVALWKV